MKIFVSAKPIKGLYEAKIIVWPYFYVKDKDKEVAISKLSEMINTFKQQLVSGNIIEVPAI